MTDRIMAAWGPANRIDVQPRMRLGCATGLQGNAVWSLEYWIALELIAGRLRRRSSASWFDCIESRFIPDLSLDRLQGWVN